MKKIFSDYGLLIASGIAGLAMSLTLARCGSDTNTANAYVQIERLARPAINEGLLRTNDNLNLFNLATPNMDLTAAAAAVVAEAAVTLEALYAGACFINGALTVAASPLQFKPAGRTCVSTGLAILNGNSIGLNATFTADAAAYANYVAGIFLPDVMRIDTTVTPVGSAYNASLCNGGAAGSPALCGGRKLDDPVMDITYAFLLNGELAPSAVPSIRNGAYYTPTVTDSTCTSVLAGGPATNACNNFGGPAPSPRQGHKPVSYAAMPWSPAPY